MKTHKQLCGTILFACLFSIASLAGPPPGSLDETFISDLENFQNAYGWRFWIQRDDRVLVQASVSDENSSYDVLIRLNADGSLDQSFSNGTRTASEIYSVAEQADGKLLIGGWFREFNGQQLHSLVRLHPNGALDESYRSEIGTNEYAIHLVQDAKNRTLIHAQRWPDEGDVVFRLGPDGRRDASFQELILTNPIVICVETNIVSRVGQKILFLSENGKQTAEVVPLDGNDMYPPFIAYRQPNGKFLLTGFEWGYGRDTNTLIRIQPDGSRDMTFLPPYALQPFRVHIEPNGNFIVATFVSTNNTFSTEVMRIRPNGELDSTFKAPPLFGEWMAVDGRGRTIVLDESSRIVRLNGDYAPELPEVRVGTLHVLVSETNKYARVVLERAGSTDGATLAGFTTMSGTAHSEVDFANTMGTVRFSAGESVKEVMVSLLDNNRVDQERSFNLVITSVSGARLGAASKSVVHIDDDEVPNRVRFAAASFPVKETRAACVITVLREIGSHGTARVRYKVDNGTARKRRDFVDVRGTLEFAEGQYTNTFVVPIIDTPAADGIRYAELRLHAAQDGVVLDDGSTAVLAIFDNESPVVVTTANDEWLRAATYGGGSVEFATEGVVKLRSPITLEGAVSINTRGHGVVIDAGGSGRHFTISSNGTVELAGLTLINGWSTNGGSVYNEGALEVKACVFSNNVARGFDGVIGTNGIDQLRTTNGLTITEATAAGRGGNASPGEGGAIYNVGSLLVFDCHFLTNSAIGGNGGAGGRGGNAFQWSMPGRGGDGGNAAAGNGGAIYSRGQVQLHWSTFAWNRAVGGAAGVLGLSGANTYASYSPARQVAAPGTTGAASGGAVHTSAELSIVACRFDDNAALGASGGDGGADEIENTTYWFESYAGSGSSATPGGTAEGGAVACVGLASSTDSFWSGNMAVGGRGGHGGNGGIAKSGQYVRDRTGGSGANGADGGHALGGAIYSLTVVSHGDVFVDNLAQAGPGGGGGGGGHSLGYRQAPLAGNGGMGGNAQGGAIFGQTVDLMDANVSRNRSAAARGGATGWPGTTLYLYIFYASPGRAGVAGFSRGGGVAASGDAHIRKSAIFDNEARGGNGMYGWSGGIIRYLRYDPPSGAPGLSGGAAFGGGAWLGGQTLIYSSTIFSNIASGGPGGRGGSGAGARWHASYGGSGGSGGNTHGGGIMFEGTAEILNSTIAYNLCDPGNGGAGGTGDGTTVDVPYNVNPTARGGSAGSVYGSGVATGSNGTAIILYSTIASNSFLTATGGLGGVSVSPAFQGAPGGDTQVFGASLSSQGNMQLRGSIVTGVGGENHVFGTVADLGFNLCSDASLSVASTSTRVSIDPGIAPLADNGGRTLTMALLPISPAINGAVDSEAPKTDQRGESRPFGPAADIGAFEAQYAAFDVSTISGSASVVLRATRDGNGIRLNFTAPPGHSCRVETSIDLISWVPVSSIPQPDGTIILGGIGATNEPQRFYRAVIDGSSK